MIRFNEAVDQMVAASVCQFAQRTERIRDLFAGVLAHDLRSPVSAIMNSARVILQDKNLSPISLRAGASLQRSAERVKVLIDDLFVFTRTRLGDRLPVDFTKQDFGRICRDAAEEVRAASPDAQIDVHVATGLIGMWDGARVSQLLVNLLNNAIQHGTGTVRLEVVSDDEQVLLTV